MTMHYAITVDNGMVSDRHESLVPITQETFKNNPMYGGHIVIPISENQEFSVGHWLAEYDEDGMLRPLIDRINDGLVPVPDGYELINGELIDLGTPGEDAPKTLLDTMLEIGEMASAAHAEEAKAARVMFKALAQTNIIKEIDALDNMTMFDQWESRIEKKAEVNEYLRYEDGLYRVQQEHIVQVHYPPGVHTASLYSKVNEPGQLEHWKSGQSYDKDIEVIHKDGVWLSMVPNNTYEPGGPGIWENIWKRLRNI